MHFAALAALVLQLDEMDEIGLVEGDPVTARIKKRTTAEILLIPKKENQQCA